jgi:glycosyltransferase involved in cell wall biosynthesis
MTNVLYIGPYREFSGMGNAARQYIKALIKAGYNICLRPVYNIYQPYPENDMSNEIVELEKNSAKKYHVCIQHSYPHQFCRYNKFDKHIGIVHIEHNSSTTELNSFLNTMDDIIVGSSLVKNSIEKYNYNSNTRIHHVPEPIDIDEIKNFMQTQTHITTSENKTYKFYTIGDLIKRKNLNDIMYAYLSLCKIFDNIELVIKLKNNQNNIQVLQQTIEYMFEQIYGDVQINISKKPKILFGAVRQEAIWHIHNINDCFINASSGESFGYSTLEALTFNRNIIVNDNIGSSEIVSEGCGLLSDTLEETCYDKDRIYPIYNTTRQKWRKPIIENLIQCMAMSYMETEKQKQNRIEKQNNFVINYSIENIISKLKLIL